MPFSGDSVPMPTPVGRFARDGGLLGAFGAGVPLRAVPFTGKEADIRCGKALLVVALIAASFAGGALVNGPGLDWARDQLVGPTDADLALADDELTMPPEVAFGAEAADAIPAAPLPPLSNSNGGPPPPIADSAPEPLPAAAPADAVASGASPPPPIAEAQDAPARPSDLLLGNPPPAAQPADLAVAAIEAARGDGDGPALSFADAPGSTAPSRPIVPGRPWPRTHVDPSVSTAALDTPAPGSSEAATGANWPDLRRRMQELGVTRYWIEGEPNGPARFRCVIPLAGGRAVGQHFEAEADDELQAADAALRRIALWRAAAASAP